MPIKATLPNSLILNQVRFSSLSKQGLKTTTGQFEGTPANAISQERPSTVPINDTTKVKPPIDITLNSRNGTLTYLGYLQQNKRI